jgi:hypothetical protein
MGSGWDGKFETGRDERGEVHPASEIPDDALGLQFERVEEDPRVSDAAVA